MTPFYPTEGRTPRYYQTIAINSAVEAILCGKQRALLVMATGTGKTSVAFQITWRLWSSRWSRSGDGRRPKVLFLANLDVLIDDPIRKDFAPFKAALTRVEGKADTAHDIYFALYQAIAHPDRDPPLYKEWPPDFFDLIIVDECHVGSAKDVGLWKDILRYFSSAVQLGLTATPIRRTDSDDDRDTFEWFGAPLYTYSLKQGIEDGFLAPYRVHHIVTDVDATGWRPHSGQRDANGNLIPDKLYQTPDFERRLRLPDRTRIFAEHLTAYLKRTDRFAKTIVFCVDQEHAEDMRAALVKLNGDLVKAHPDYVVRVTADEQAVGKAHLGNFMLPKKKTPVILTTSRMLTTGVDAATCQNIVICRVVGRMPEFKQIIGRGTRVRTEFNKWTFSILDYSGSAALLFADPAFDGDPLPPPPSGNAPDDDGGTRVEPDTTIYDPDGEATPPAPVAPPPRVADGEGPVVIDPPGGIDDPGKITVEGLRVRVAAEQVQVLDPQGHVLTTHSFTDYTGQKVRTLYPSCDALRTAWSTPEGRHAIIDALGERGIDIEELVSVTNRPDADPFDLLAHLAFKTSITTRRSRVERVRIKQAAFFAEFAPPAREILDDLLDLYAKHGPADLDITAAVQIEPIRDKGTLPEIIARFGNVAHLREALLKLNHYLYAA
jgi:type I restriction enzyme R subunit